MCRRGLARLSVLALAGLLVMLALVPARGSSQGFELLLLGSSTDTSAPLPPEVQSLAAPEARVGGGLVVGGVGTEATESCTFTQTKYAEANGNGDSLWAVGDTLEAFAAAHAHTTLVPGQVRIANAHAVAGHRLTFVGDLATVNGRVFMPWHVIGEIVTQIQSSFFNRTSASGTASLKLGLLDETTLQSQEVTVAGPWTSQGQAAKTFGADWNNPGKFNTFANTYVRNHTYRPYIRIDVSATVGGALLNPALQADARTDFYFPNGFGSYLEFVRYDFDLPTGFHVTCTP